MPAKTPAFLNISAAAARTPEPVVDTSEDKWQVTASLPSGESVTVHLNGATVMSWKNTDGSENIWLSTKSALDGSKAIRGGIPIVFPVFGPPPKSGHATSSLPQHGFARNVRWEYLGKSTSEAAGIKLDFGLGSETIPEQFGKAWSYKFGLVYSVTLAPNTLTTMLHVRNDGEEKFEFQSLLHSYWAVEDIGKVKVTGLAGVKYIDKVLNATEQTQSEPEISIQGEVDRVYSNIPQPTTSIVQDGKSRFDITRDGLSDTVVWNPWKEKAASMGDYEPKDGYLRMLAIEVGSVSQWITLEGGDEWEGGQVVKSNH